VQSAAAEGTRVNRVAERHEPRPEAPTGRELDVGAGYKILLDVPSRQPALGFPENAVALKEVISESDARFAIGIFGGWGSGKTTLMRAIQKNLDDDSVIAVEFSAWRYEKEEHLIVPLLDTVREALLEWGEQHREDRELARETAATVGKVMKSILAGVSLKFGVPGAIDVSFDANKALEARRQMRQADDAARIPRSFYHASFRALRDAFKSFVGSDGDRRIVVFIDDLDRCLPESALQVLESMKLFFDLEGFVFVVGLDRAVVQFAIDSKYGHEGSAAGNGDAKALLGRVSGEEYIKKIFQVPFNLAPVSVEQLEDFLKVAYAEAGLPDAQRAELGEFLEPHLRAVIGDAPVNPREIKRYINSYTLQTKMNPDLERHPILALQTIDFRSDWKNVLDAVRGYRQLFIASLRRQVVDKEPTALQELDPELDQISQDFLDYVDPEQPGGPLLEVEDVDRYLYSGEAVRSTHNRILLDAIHGAGKMGLALRKALKASELNSEVLRGIRSQVGLVESALSSTRGALTTLAFQDLEEFSQLLSELESRYVDQTPSFEDVQAEVEDLEVEAVALSLRLKRLYRAGDIGPSQAPHEPAEAQQRVSKRNLIPPRPGTTFKSSA
jgi:KAP family P-loop domain